MFLYLSKLLTPFVYPVGLPIVLLAFGLLFRRRRWWALPCTGALILLLAFSSGTVADALIGPLENAYPPRPIAEMPAAQAIVVLGGSVNVPNERRPLSGLGASSDRLLHAIRLYKAGKAPLVLLTGGNVEYFTGAGRTPEARVAADLLVDLGLPAGAIRTEERSRNTRENAVFSRAILAPLGVNRILLVTSAYHMRRSLGLFRRVGFDAIPAPTDYQTGWDNPQFPFGLLPDVSSVARSTEAIHEWIGLFVYWRRGWLA
jgi:uncharacterized SAM-binding protein YcdF (DUF218 family)